MGDPLFAAYPGDLRLTQDSPAVDVGADLGETFEGAAPDLGAFERGQVPEPDGGTGLDDPDAGAGDVDDGAGPGGGGGCVAAAGDSGGGWVFGGLCLLLLVGSRRPR